MKKIYYNAKVITADDNLKHARAICVENGKFLAVGSDEEVLTHRDGAELIDMQGSTILPGFYDTHMHLLAHGAVCAYPNLSGCDSIESVIDFMKKYIADNNLPDGAWIRARGWNEENFKGEQRLLTRHDLDKISTKHMLSLIRARGRMIVTNSYALALMDMTGPVPEADRDKIFADEQGMPLGQFVVTSDDSVPELSVEEVKKLYKASAAEAMSFGIVEIQSDDFKDVKTNYRKIITAYEELLREDAMPMRVYEQCNLPSVDYIQAYIDDGYHLDYGAEFYRLGPLKLVPDGTLGARTAHMSVPYADDPTTSGVMFFTEDELQGMTDLWYSKGWPLLYHAIGDGALDILLRVIERTRAKYPGVKLRDGIVHCQITRPDQIDKMKELGLIAFIQPVFLNYDVQIVEARVGVERAGTSYNWKEIIDKGVMATGGSDCPVESCNTFQNMYSAMLRKRLNGEPEGGWRPEQNIGFDEALKMFTINAAYASHSEHYKGSITAGKHADFVVVNEDVENLDPHLLKEVLVQETYVNGECKFKR